MKKINFKTTTLQKGTVQVYNFDKCKLHAYQTNNPLNEEVFLLEKEGRGIIIESMGFTENVKEFNQYVCSTKVNVEGILLSYHMAGGENLVPETKIFSTEKAYNFAHKGKAKELTKNFKLAFGEKFDDKINNISDYIKHGIVNIARIVMEIKETEDAFDIELPEINSIYIYMLSHDSHSIVEGKVNADILIKQLKNYLKKGYDLVLSSHNVPENSNDLKTKIAYLEDLKKAAAKATSQKEFKQIMKKKYPNYKSENYLDMTAGFFFK
ncbi:MAG: hypothetical protein LBD19_02450 [Endomicrobium sp.]|jgi:hypothetical protein|nr:hypothetical protein [Endomicrobium sp.]